jgi:hypothetical protein
MLVYKASYTFMFLYAYKMMMVLRSDLQSPLRLQMLQFVHSNPFLIHRLYYISLSDNYKYEFAPVLKFEMEMERFNI